MTLLVHGARKLDADGIVDGFWILASEEGILATGSDDGWRSHAEPAGSAGSAGSPRSSGSAGPALEVVDADGAWLTPGFIDLHCHGGGGHSFDDGAESIRDALAVHRAHGTTRSAISLVSAPLPALVDSLEDITALCAADPLILGAHLEGPFLDAGHRGAHDPDALRTPSPLDVAELLEAADGRLAQITLAPELPGGLAAVEAFVGAGVVVAVGHTGADLDIAREAFDRGATLVTHAFNAMPGIHHRHPGPLTAAFDDERVTLELIVDGLHVDPAVVQLAFRAAGERVALVTDAMAAAAAPDGFYRLGSREVDVAGGRAVLAGTDMLAGSTLTLDRALAIAVDRCGASPEAAVRALTLSPALVLGRTDLGLLRPGFAADLVLLSPTWEVRTVVAAGRVVR